MSVEASEYTLARPFPSTIPLDHPDDDHCFCITKFVVENEKETRARE